MCVYFFFPESSGSRSLTRLLLSGHLAASVMLAISRTVTVGRQGACHVARGTKRKTKRQLVLPQVTERCASFFPPSLRVSFELGPSTTCYPGVAPGWLVDQVSLECPATDANAKAKSLAPSSRAARSDCELAVTERRAAALHHMDHDELRVTQVEMKLRSPSDPAGGD